MRRPGYRPRPSRGSPAAILAVRHIRHTGRSKRSTRRAAAVCGSRLSHVSRMTLRSVFQTLAKRVFRVNPRPRGDPR